MLRAQALTRKPFAHLSLTVTDRGHHEHNFAELRQAAITHECAPRTRRLVASRHLDPARRLLGLRRGVILDQLAAIECVSLALHTGHQRTGHRARPSTLVLGDTAGVLCHGVRGQHPH